MHDNTDFDILLTELAAEQPMNRATLIAKMKAEFTSDELRHIIVNAGAALVIHGGKPTAADADANVDSLDVLKAMAAKRGLTLSTSQVNGMPRLEIGGFAELFYDPVAKREVYQGVSPRFVVVDGVKFDSIPATVAWYEYMVRKVNRPKDHANLALAKSLSKETM